MSRVLQVSEELWERDRGVLVETGTWPPALCMLDLAYWSDPERPLPAHLDLARDWSWPPSSVLVLLARLPKGHRLHRAAAGEG